MQARTSISCKKGFTLLETLIGFGVLVLILATAGFAAIFCSNLTAQSISQSWSGSLSTSSTGYMIHAIEGSNAVMSYVTLNGTTYQSCGTGLVLRQSVTNAEGYPITGLTQFQIYYVGPDGQGNSNLYNVTAVLNGGNIQSSTGPAILERNVASLNFLYFQQATAGGPSGPQTASPVTEAIDTSQPTSGTFNSDVSYTSNSVSENAFNGMQPADMGSPDGTGASSTVYIEIQMSLAGQNSKLHISGARIRSSA